MQRSSRKQRGWAQRYSGSSSAPGALTIASTPRIFSSTQPPREPCCSTQQAGSWLSQDSYNLYLGHSDAVGGPVPRSSLIIDLGRRGSLARAVSSTRFDLLWRTLSPPWLSVRPRHIPAPFPSALSRCATRRSLIWTLPHLLRTKNATLPGRPRPFHPTHSRMNPPPGDPHIPVSLSERNTYPCTITYHPGSGTRRPPDEGYERR